MSLRRMIGGWLLLVLLGSLSVLAEKPRIAIGSKAFTESRLLGEIMAQLLESEGFEVDRRLNLGGTTIVLRAIQAGEIDLYAEYTGTGWAVYLERTDRVTDPLRVYSIVAEESRARFDLEWLQPFGFNNGYALAMPRETAQRLGIETISDLLAHQDELTAGVSHEFLDREDGFPGLARAYGLRIGTVRGMEHGLAYEALRSGRVDLTDTYTTDGKLLRFDVRLLQDDRRFFPPYDAVPVVRRETLERHPRLRTVLGRLAFGLDDGRMRALNAAVEDGGGNYAAVARRYLVEAGLLVDASGQVRQVPEPGPGSQTDPATSTADAAQAGVDRGDGRPGLWERIAPRIVEHLILTVVAVLMAVALALPLGLYLTRRPRAAGPVLAAAGVLQTIPGLALLALMIPIPFLGLGARSAIAALFLYALLPILRNTVTGVRDVDPELVEAARGMGLTDLQILRHVELPLATRTILAGVRIATVISIGVATLAAFIGAGGLGDPIVTGLQLNDMTLVLAGAIPAALLAIVADFGLGLLERRWSAKGLEV